MAIEVKDIMGRVAIAVMKDAPLTEIAEAMKRFAVSAVTVIDADRRPVGVVFEDDLLLTEADTVRPGVPMSEPVRQRQDHQKPADTMAAQLMTSPAITVTPGTCVRDAALLMHATRIKQIPVINVVTGRIMGTLHQRDVLRAVTRPAEELDADIGAVLPSPETFTIEIDQGVVRISGAVEWRSQAVALTEKIRMIEGVVDVRSDVTFDKDDLLTVPPGM
ncbi:CBS domain-containing protein [Nonomuraea sp. B19D2]|uniref:CBS domain-containing protein n=1 Tax=Nonomuraea sp. B19D2 TaxID=3159561 RepID=UPI0032DA1653